MANSGIYIAANRYRSKMFKTLKSSVISQVILVTLLAPTWVHAEKIPIDQVPMYGGMDRNSEPMLRQGDEEFITGVVGVYGSRSAASEAWVENADVYYRSGQLDMAMRRYNQAWLLDPNNGDVYWGFASILYDWGKTCEAVEIGRKAQEVGLESMIPPNRATYLADLGLMTTVCAAEEGLRKRRAKKLISESDELFTRSEELWKSPHLYDQWWQALFWRNDYSGAWQKIFLMREAGEEPHPAQLQYLINKMPEPASNVN